MREWLDALIEAEGAERATFRPRKLLQHARSRRVKLPPVFNTLYCNTIPLAEQPQFPGNLEVEQRLIAVVRWNALARVVRANRASTELGGGWAGTSPATPRRRIYSRWASTTSSGRAGGGPGVSPAALRSRRLCARLLQGRLSDEHLAHYRRECGGKGLSSYPHPMLMPDFWQFATGSMGISPINGIYQARFMRYLRDRGIGDTSCRKVYPCSRRPHLR